MADDAFIDTPLQEALAVLGACQEAREWVGEMTVEEAWVSCTRQAWLRWILTHTGLAVCTCSPDVEDGLPNCPMTKLYTTKDLRMFCSWREVEAAINRVVAETPPRG